MKYLLSPALWFLSASFPLFANPPIVSPPEVLTKTFDVKNISKLDLSIPEGIVQIQGERDLEKATVTIQKHKEVFNSLCNVQLENVGKTLVVSITKPAHSALIKCESEIYITLPAEIYMNIKSELGSISTKGTRGEISYDIKKGNISLVGEISALKGKSGDAIIDIQGLTGSATIEGNAISLSATYLVVQRSGSIKIKAKSGTSQIFMPSDSIIAPPHLETGHGKLYNEIPTALHAYSVSSEVKETGDLVIKKLLK